MTDEILVKGTDGKWYILKGEELVPVEEKQETRSKKQELVSVISPAVITSHLPMISHAEHPLRVELDELVDSVVVEIKNLMPHASYFMDQVLTKRFRTIVSARLRDVRDAAETRAMLMRDQKIGGMGFIGELGIRNQELGVMEIIEKAFAKFQQKWRAVEDKKIEEWKKKQRKEGEARPADGDRPYKGPLPPRRNVETDEGTLRRKAADAPKMVSPHRQAAPLGEEKKQVTSPLPKPYTLTPRTSKVTDIRPAPKLLGPVEELASLTLEDFRRLGAVEEAVKKIISRVEVLGAQGLTRRLDGIKAWQNSPLHRLYMDLTAAAFAQRKSVDAVIADRQGRNEPTLTSAEFHGIMDLNAKFRV